MDVKVVATRDTDHHHLEEECVTDHPMVMVEPVHLMEDSTEEIEMTALAVMEVVVAVEVGVILMTVDPQGKEIVEIVLVIEDQLVVIVVDHLVIDHVEETAWDVEIVLVASVVVLVVVQDVFNMNCCRDQLRVIDLCRFKIYGAIPIHFLPQ